MAEPTSLYPHRRRQVLAVVFIGASAVALVAVLAAMLPSCADVSAVSTGGRVHLITRAMPLPEQARTFMMSLSDDGRRFDPAVERSGSPVTVEVDNSLLYMQFDNGRTMRFDDEEPTLLSSDLGAPIIGLGRLADNLVAFAFDREKGLLTVGALDNETWKPRRTMKSPSADPVFISAGRFEATDVLIWQNTPTEEEKRERQFDFSIHLAKVTDNGLTPLPSLDFGGPVDICGGGEGGALDVYWRHASPGVGLFGADPDIIRRRVFKNGAWQDDEPISLPSGPFLRMRQATVTKHQDAMYVYGCQYWFGLLYAGVYATEFRGERPSEKFRVIAPTEREIDNELTWLLQAVAATFLAAGGVAGMLRLRHFEDQVTLMPDQPLYASVIERATAASLDFVLVFIVTRLAAGKAHPFDFWITFIFMYAMYGTLMESVAQGQTLGKKLMGLRVLTTDGALPAFGPVLQRNALKFFEMLTLGVGCCLVTRRFQRPGDLLGGTVVIKERVMPKFVGEGER